MLAKVLTGNITFSSLKPPDLSCCTKEDLRRYFENSYDLNESLFTALKDDSAFYKCPDRLRLPLIFYYAHTAVVYVNKLMLAGLMKERVNLEFETMFETGVDEMSWDDTENYRMGGSYKWPSLEVVVDYRRSVKNIILNIIQNTPLELPITMESPWWALLMGMEHERIHLETSSVLIRQLPVEMVQKPEGWVYGPIKSGSGIQRNNMIRVKGKNIKLGKPEEFPSYGWDNEYGEVDCFVPEFEASEYMVTNKEFLEFVKAGGYEKKEFWTEEGWLWKQYKQANHPLFWVCNEGCRGGCGADLSSYSHCRITDAGEANGTNGYVNGYQNGVTNGEQNGVVNGSSNGTNDQTFKYRAMFDVLDMPWSWPVDVNYHEAKAFCTWKGGDYRLPTEAEHNVIRGYQAPVENGTASDIIYNKKIEANLNLQYGSSTPVNLFPKNELGFYDAFGNVWEWVEDHFNGLCNYKSHWLYDDFSSPCFDGRHNLILGGSWVSTGDEASRFARFAFRRHFFQHAGFRLAKTTTQGPTKLPARLINTEVFVLGIGVQDNPIILDTDKLEPELVPTTNTQYTQDTEYTLKGILEQEFGFRKSFPVAVAHHSLHQVSVHKVKHADLLWLGAGTGLGPFVMSASFDKVLGVDCGGRLIDAALKLQRGEEMSFVMSNGEESVACLNAEHRPEKVVFKQLTWLPNEVEPLDVVVVTFLERLLHAKAWLKRLPEIVKPAGMLIVASQDRSWNKEKLLPILDDHFRCTNVDDVQYDSPTSNTVAVVTTWLFK